MSSVEPVRVTSPIAMRATRAESASESLTIKGRRSRNRRFADSLLEGNDSNLRFRELLIGAGVADSVVAMLPPAARLRR